MEDENEVLDWGNEDDEQQHQELQRKASFADLDTRRNSGDADDVEDSVSLGEDEDEQDRYDFQEQDANGLNNEDSKPASTPKSTSQNNSQHQSHSSRDLRREDSSTTQLNSSAGSPHRNQGSMNQQSPHRSQSFTSTTRITHALPPKPVVTNVPFLHPSHPSIVEATAMSTRTTGRSESNQSMVNGTSSTTASTGTGGGKSASSGPLDLDSTPLPPGWEESTWSRPVSSSTSTSRGGNTRRRRGSTISAGDRSFSPPNSDLSHSQELRSNRAPPPGQPDILDPQKSSSGPNSGLTYKDRHYRPAGAEDDPIPAENGRRGDRSDVDPRFNPQPERAFTPPASPHRSREHERSLSPPLVVNPAPPRGRDTRSSRGARSSRGGRLPNTDADLATHRNRDPPADFGPSRGNWGPELSEAPNDFNGYQQAPRRPQRQQHHQNADPPFEAPPFEERFEERPTMHRNGSTRSRNRDREHPRPMEMRENRTQNMTAPRTRSPPPHLSDREQAYQAQHEAEQPPTPLSVSAPSSTQGAQPSRRRERPSRFDRPTATTSPVLSSLIASFSTPEAAAAAAATYLNRLDDDIYVPDDILAPQDQPRSHETARAELTRPSNSQQVVSADGFGPSRYPSKRTRADDREFDKDYGPSSSEIGRSSPSSEARPKRVPLPPQSARFRQASQPQRPPPSDKGATSQIQHRPRPQLSPLPSNVLPLGPRDQRPTNANSVANNGPPSGPRYPPQNQNHARGEPESSRTMPLPHASGSNDRDRRGERRLSGTAYSHSLAPSENIMDIDVDDHPSTSRIPPSPSSRKPSDEPGLRIGSGMYADRETAPAGDALPRGPRAMAKPLVSTSGSGYASHSTSPTTPFGYGPGAGGRPRDRSPPPHLQGRENDSNGRREYEVDPYAPHPMDRVQGRRESRPRPNDFTRAPPPGHLKLSGTNSVPIGGNRKPPVVLGAPPPGKVYVTNAGPPPGISTANMEPVRNMRMRGAPPPNKESYERPTYNEKSFVDSYRPGRSENGGPRQLEDSPVMVEPRQLSPVNLTNAHDTNRGRRDGGYADRGNQGRYNQAPPQDVGRPPPRTWTPREPSPPRDLPRSHHDQHRPMTPPIPNELSQTSPTWTPREVARQYEDLSIHKRDRGPALKLDSRPIQHRDEALALSRERFTEPDIRHGGSLERRLSEPYNERYPEPARQPHALPPNPALHRGHNPMRSPEAHWKDDRHDSGPIHARWGEPQDAAPHGSNEAPPSQAFNDQARVDVDMRSSRPPRIRRPPGDSTLRMDMDILPSHPLPQEYDAPQRPEISRRGGSLLDRLSLDQNGDIPADGSSQSLRDRVQVPSKRDREEMMGDRHGYLVDSSLEDDGYDSNKKARRRSGKVRKVRRGGPP